MPTISSFYGITIVMRPRGKEHNPPHVHATMQGFDVPVSIDTGEVMEGELPPKANAMVKEFVETYREELMEMWDSGVYKKLEPIY